MEEKLKTLRNDIDSIDEQIMKLLEARFELSLEVGKIKVKNDLSIESTSREDTILKKANDLKYGYHVKNIYHTLFEESKTLQRNQK